MVEVEELGNACSFRREHTIDSTSPLMSVVAGLVKMFLR